MMTQITCLALAAATAILTAFPTAHHHCDAAEDPLCTPKGVVAGNRGEFPGRRCAPGPNGGVVCTG